VFTWIDTDRAESSDVGAAGQRLRPAALARGHV